MAPIEATLPYGWRRRWPTVEEIAEHEESADGKRAWWLARCSLRDLEGLLFVGFFDGERQFTVLTPSAEHDYPTDSWATTIASGWSFCPIDDWGLPRHFPKPPGGLSPELALADLRLDYLLALKALDERKAIHEAALRHIEELDTRVLELILAASAGRCRDGAAADLVDRSESK